MNHFRYKLIDASGEISSGVVKLPYEEVLSAISHLERDGAITIYVKKLSRVSAWLFDLGKLRWHGKLSRTVQAEVLNNLALMLRSGVPLVTALRETAESTEIPGFASDFNDLITRIQGGASFSEAAQTYPHIFPRSVLHLIRIGEETGQLDKMLKDASEHLKRIQVIVSDTKQALLYPAFVFFAIGAGLIFWFYFVVPKIIELFQDMDVALPWITLFLIAVSDLIQAYFFHILIGIGGGFFMIAAAYKKSMRFKKATDAALLKLPIIKTLITASALAFITEYLALLISAGIDILQSVKIIEESLSNAVYRAKLAEVGGGMSKGEGVAESFKKAVIFPPFVVRMIGIGEVSGTLSDQLIYIADEYRHKLTTLVATMGKMIEPLVLIVAGVIFAIIIGGLFLPIYDLVANLTAA